MKVAVQDLGEAKGRITVKVKVVLSFLRRGRRSWLDSVERPYTGLENRPTTYSLRKTFVPSCKIYTRWYKARKRKVVPATIWVGKALRPIRVASMVRRGKSSGTVKVSRG